MPSQLPELSLEALSQCFKQFAFHVNQQASPLYAQLSVTVADDLELLTLAEVSLRLISSLQRSIFCCSKWCSIPSQRSILVSLSSLSAMQIPIPPSAQSAMASVGRDSPIVIVIRGEVLYAHPCLNKGGRSKEAVTGGLSARERL